MAITIREATPADLGTLARFNAAMARETEGKTLDPASLEAGIRAALTDPGRGFYLIAEVSGTVAGGLMVTTEWSDWRNAWFWWIQSVYVLPEFRRRGVYRALHERVRDLARADGRVCGIRLYVDRENARAKRTYEDLGMRHDRYEFFAEDLPKDPGP